MSETMFWTIADVVYDHYGPYGSRLRGRYTAGLKFAGQFPVLAPKQAILAVAGCGGFLAVAASAGPDVLTLLKLERGRGLRVAHQVPAWTQAGGGAEGA